MFALSLFVITNLFGCATPAPAAPVIMTAPATRPADPVGTSVSVDVGKDGGAVETKAPGSGLAIEVTPDSTKIAIDAKKKAGN